MHLMPLLGNVYFVAQNVKIFLMKIEAKSKPKPKTFLKIFQKKLFYQYV